MEPANWRRSARANGLAKRGGLLGVALMLFGGLGSMSGQETLQWQELYDLLRTNLVGTTKEELNRAAVSGLIRQLAPRVQLIEDGASSQDSPATAAGPAVSTAVFEKVYGYIRIARMGPETGRDFQIGLDGLNASNTLQGLVLDLRFATGGDYGAAVAVADRFFSGAQNLVNWGEGMKTSTAKSNAITLPTTVLINQGTAGASEVLAGILRHGEVALLVGTNTAGQASATKDFALTTGQKLRVATAPVKVLNGQELPFTGLKPDIDVMAGSPEEELAFMADAYRAVKGAGGAAGLADASLSSTNNRPRRRMNEAELVRLTREGQDPREPLASSAPSKPSEPAAPQVTDPVLARALDILKGLSVVQRFRGL